MIKIKKLILSLTMVIIINSCSKIKPKENNLEGSVFGTSFHITYLDKNDIDYSLQIDSLFQLVNHSLSTYDPNSDISKINNGDSTIIVDAYFKEVYTKAKRIYNETGGVFDPTIGVLVNAWGFGPGKEFEKLNDKNIKELLFLVGYNKVKLIDGRVMKQQARIFLDYNAIAKGYGIDIISRFIESKAIKNYMVEIGGEVRVRGKNGKNNFWRIGIEEPNFNGTRSLQQVVQLKNESMATSGNYRKFKIDAVTGQKYAHTIDTKTGYTAKRDVLSASVISSIDCADVDGYATAFMAMGFEKTKTFVKSHPELKVFLIYLDENGETKSYANFMLSE
jgi:thiamine biosynthesis lipoprotein